MLSGPTAESHVPPVLIITNIPVITLLGAGRGRVFGAYGVPEFLKVEGWEPKTGKYFLLNA